MTTFSKPRLEPCSTHKYLLAPDTLDIVLDASLKREIEALRERSKHEQEHDEEEHRVTLNELKSLRSVPVSLWYFVSRGLALALLPICIVILMARVAM